jgi:hypothetical protein
MPGRVLFLFVANHQTVKYRTDDRTRNNPFRDHQDISRRSRASPTSNEEVRRNIASQSRKIPASLWSDLKAEGLLESHVPVPA